MPFLNLSDVVNDPDFAQEYHVVRQSGLFGLGSFIVESVCRIPFWGIIQPATAKDLVQVAEADRAIGMLGFISERQMYTTHTEELGSSSGLSDTIEWRGHVYKIVSAEPWKDFGFWKAIGSRQSGA